MRVRFVMGLVWMPLSCAPAWQKTWVLASEMEGVTALAIDGERAAVIHPDGYSLVTSSEAGTIETVARVTGASKTFAPHQGGAKLVGDRLVVVTFDTLELFDVSVAPELRQGSVPLPDFRGSYELVGTTLYASGGTYDISDVTQPRLIEAVGFDAGFMAFAGDYMYAVSSDYGRFDVHSIADPEAPVLLSQLPISEFGDMSSDAGFYLGYVYPVGDHVIVHMTLRGENANRPPMSVNVADPAAPFVAQGLSADRYTECGLIIPQLERDGGLLGLVTSGWFVRPHGNFGSLGVVDVRDPAAPDFNCDAPVVEGLNSRAALDVGWLGEDTLLLVQSTDSGPLTPSPVDASLMVFAPK